MVMKTPGLGQMEIRRNRTNKAHKGIKVWSGVAFCRFGLGRFEIPITGLSIQILPQVKGRSKSGCVCHSGILRGYSERMIDPEWIEADILVVMEQRSN